MISQLNSWLSPKLRSSYSYWKLCYRASVDGWRSRTFHNRCDNKGATVTIVKVGSYIFGGYNDKSWQGKFSNVVSMAPWSSFVQNNVLNLGWGRRVCFTTLLSFVTFGGGGGVTTLIKAVWAVLWITLCPHGNLEDPPEFFRGIPHV